MIYVVMRQHPCRYCGYSEAGSEILARRMNKPGITFEMQTVLVCDIHRNRPRAYTHWYKVWKNPEIEWTKQGPSEICRMIVKFVESWSSLVTW
jgi:hypothetical protein